MKAKDVMTASVVTVSPTARVHEVARLLAAYRISAVPVVDEQRRVIGIVSEGDLLRRKEIGTNKRRSWWLELFAGPDTLAQDYAKAHSLAVRDLMSAPVISVAEDTPLAEIADIIEEHAIKRVTVIREGKLVGIVSRADLVRALAGTAGKVPARLDDKAIRNTLLQRVHAQPWASTSTLNFVVAEGVIELNGIVPSGEQHKALRVLAETVPGVKAVKDRLVEMPHLPTGV
jgi:CBS domain-containing protein